jgi:hypothetical protein
VESYSLISVLMYAAFGLMVVVSGGVIYLTLADWRDRRRQDEDKRADRKPRRR